MTRLSLADALASNKLEDFVAQAEADGVGPVDRAQFEKMVERITAPLQVDQTSHLPADDYSPET
jgi:hypothetical protein